MKKEKTFEKQMLEKYPNLYNGESCYICKADLRYLHGIHRINFEWYCHKCYLKKKYIFPNIIEVYNRVGDCSKGICPIINGVCLMGHKNSCCNCFHNPHIGGQIEYIDTDSIFIKKEVKK